MNKKQVSKKKSVVLLYKIFKNVQIDCVSSRCKMIATVNGQQFEGTGKYKDINNNGFIAFIYYFFIDYLLD